MKEIKTSALTGFLITLPFILLEWFNGFQGGFPFAVFGMMWFLAAVFVLLARIVFQKIRTSKFDVGLLFQIALLILVVLIWSGFVQDQMPCFMGVPNCD